MRAINRMKKNNAGFTLVELMIVVAIVGILAAIAIVGYRKYVANSKGGEAKSIVGAIAKAAVAAYEKPAAANEMIVEGGTGSQTVNILCRSASPVPAQVPANKKYQPQTATGQDFNAGDSTTGWTCLNFSLTQPIFFSYQYVTGVGTGLGQAENSGFEAAAFGDLNGNAGNAAPGRSAQISTYARGAAINNGELKLSSTIASENEGE